MGAFDDLIPKQSSSGTFDDLIPKAKTQEDFAKETLDEMPWAQRQLVGAGGALHKGYQGIKGLLGGEIDQDAIKYADVAGREAPIGSMIGEVAKYAPVALAGTAVLPAAALAGATRRVPLCLSLLRHLKTCCLLSCYRSPVGHVYRRRAAVQL